MTPRSIAPHACVLLVSLLGCGDASEPPRAPEACTPDAHGAALTSEALAMRGAFSVGELELDLVDETRSTPAHAMAPELGSRTLPTRIWYPATSDGDGTTLAAGGPFPLVVYSHGFSSYNSEGEALASHLASHGYVVFAPEFPLTHLSTPGGPTIIDLPNQPGDVSFVIDTALAFHAEAGNVLEGAIDATRIAAVGLSLGGITSLLATYHPTLHDPRIIVTAVMAPPTDILGEAFYDTRVVPLLLISGDIDAIVQYEYNAVVGYARANPPASLLTLANGTHTGFTSISMVFEGANNADEIGCSAISGGGGEGPAFDLVGALGGAAAGIEEGFPGIDCPSPLPPGLSPTRQLALERLAVLSFLDAYLHEDAETRDRSCHYSERVLPRERELRLERK